MSISFLHPEYFKLFFLALALLPFWAYQFFVKYGTRRSLGHSESLKRLSHLSSLRRECLRYVLVNLVFSLLIFSLAHPQVIREKKIAQPKKMAIVFLLDTSPSMRAQDVWPSRLERALEVIGRFSRNKPSQDRIGLVSFSAGSLILSYLTEDPNNILYYLDYLREDSIPSPGTNIGRALRSGLNVLEKEQEANSGGAYHKKIFILVSDGEDHGEELKSAVGDVRRKGIKVHAVGIGSEEGAPIPVGQENGKVKYLEDEQGNKIITRFDEGTLRWIAEETGGNAYRSLTGQELGTIFGEIVLKEREIEGFKKAVEYQDVYHGLLLAAFGIFLVAMVI